MQHLPESELIINSRGAIYHLDARPEEIAPVIITVGDPGRVQQVSKHFDRIEHKMQHREFITHTGYIGNMRLSVVSTGIGPDNIDIALNELDALVNIDFGSRIIKKDLTSLVIIRLGTSGSLRQHIPVDSFVAGTHGLGLDNLLTFYKASHTAEEQAIAEAFCAHINLGTGSVHPYVYAGSAKLLELFTEGYHRGITVTCPGFYGPQGRVLRLALAYPQLVNLLSTFSHKEHIISNFEMESSAIYGLGKCLGHRCLSLNVIVANRITKQFSNDSTRAVERLIEHSLNILAHSGIS